MIRHVQSFPSDFWRSVERMSQVCRVLTWNRDLGFFQAEFQFLAQDSKY